MLRSDQRNVGHLLVYTQNEGVLSRSAVVLANNKIIFDQLQRFTMIIINTEKFMEQEIYCDLEDTL